MPPSSSLIGDADAVAWLRASSPLLNDGSASREAEHQKKPALTQVQHRPSKPQTNSRTKALFVGPGLAAVRGATGRTGRAGAVLLACVSLPERVFTLHAMLGGGGCVSVLCFGMVDGLGEGVSINHR